MKPTIQILANAACFFVVTACSNSQEVFTEKKIVIASKQTITEKQLGLSITNHGCGRKWISVKDQPSFERSYCDLEIRLKDSTIHAGGDSKPVYIGNVEIRILKMNPWGVEEDSVPPGGCRVWVRRVEGR